MRPYECPWHSPDFLNNHKNIGANNFCAFLNIKYVSLNSLILSDILNPGGYSVRKMMGVCRWPLKIGPKRSREKWNWGPKRSNSVRIGSFNTPKDRFGVGGWEKIPQKDRARSCQSEKRGSKTRHVCITHHIGSKHVRSSSEVMQNGQKRSFLGRITS